MTAPDQPAPVIEMRLLTLAIVLLAGCGQVPMLPSLTPYKVDIQQGNYVSQEMVAKLKPGMTRSQVKFILGTPLVVDPFRNDRWDYVYLYNKAGELTEQRRIAVIFENDKLKRIEGDVIPAEAKTAAGEGAQSKARSPEGEVSATQPAAGSQKEHSGSPAPSAKTEEARHSPAR